MCAAMKNSCTRFCVLTFAAMISLAGVCAEAGKCVVTYTFDDGLADQYTIAYPMFRKAGLPATFFIIGSKVGDPLGIRSKAERNTPLMTWDQIRDMSTNGMEIASHGAWRFPLMAVHRSLLPCRKAIRTSANMTRSVIEPFKIISSAWKCRFRPARSRSRSLRPILVSSSIESAFDFGELLPWWVVRSDVGK